MRATAIFDLLGPAADPLPTPGALPADRRRWRPLRDRVKPLDERGGVRCGHHAADRFIGDPLRQRGVELVALDEMVVEPRHVDIGAEPRFKEMHASRTSTVRTSPWW